MTKHPDSVVYKKRFRIPMHSGITPFYELVKRYGCEVIKDSTKKKSSCFWHTRIGGRIYIDVRGEQDGLSKLFKHFHYGEIDSDRKISIIGDVVNEKP